MGKEDTSVKRYDVLTIGETMIRLSPPDHQRLEQATELEMRIGGAESNVAVGLARLGLRVAWVSRLVDNPLGRRIAYELRRHGVDTSHVVWTDQGRVATYFIEFGSRPRPTTILYDRCDSAMSHMGVGDIDWSLIGQSRLIHLTGITAALSPSCYDLVREAIHVAKGTAVEVSFDLNYRAKLWAPSEAKAKLDPICREVDILSASREDLTTIFGLKGSAEELLDRVQEKYARKLVIITLGAKGAICGDKAPINRDKAPINRDKEKVYWGKARPTLAVDRVGSGDAHMAGFLYGYLTEGIEKGLAYASAMASLKRTIPGDLAIVTKEEVEALLEEEDSRIRR